MVAHFTMCNTVSILDVLNISNNRDCSLRAHLFLRYHLLYKYHELKRKEIFWYPVESVWCADGAAQTEDSRQESRQSICTRIRLHKYSDLARGKSGANYYGRSGGGGDWGGWLLREKWMYKGKITHFKRRKKRSIYNKLEKRIFS